MPRNLKRHYDCNHLHFITFSCYRRLPLLRAPRRRDILLKILESVRRRYDFPVLGYVIMPEHVHLLIGLPRRADPSVVLKVVKQESAKRFLRKRSPTTSLFHDTALTNFWQRRFYDFNVFTDRKRVEKLRYIHHNPVRRGLVLSPEQWKWSSYRYYMLEEVGDLKITRFEELPLPPIPSLNDPKLPAK